jgi:hypothetical protein
VFQGSFDHAASSGVVPTPTFGLGPQDLRYGAYPIPGKEPFRSKADLVPPGSPLPCEPGKKWEGGTCVCINDCDPGREHVGTNCKCGDTECIKNLPKNLNDIPEVMIKIVHHMSVWCDKIEHPNEVDYLIPHAAGIIASSSNSFTIRCYKLSGSWGKLSFPGDFDTADVLFVFGIANSESIIMCRDKWDEAAKKLLKSQPAFSFKKWFDEWYPSHKNEVIALS